MKASDKWTYHFGDSEIWNDGGGYDTREEAITAGRKEARVNTNWHAECGKWSSPEDFLKSGTFAVGEICEYVPTIDGGWVLDTLGEDAYDKAGECSEDWLSYPSRLDKAAYEKWRSQVDTLTERLTSVFNEWAKETGNEPGFFTISGTETVKITEEAAQEKEAPHE